MSSRFRNGRPNGFFLRLTELTECRPVKAPYVLIIPLRRMPMSSSHSTDTPSILSATSTHAPSISGYVRRRVLVDDVEDVVAQVFLVAWRRFTAIPAPPEDRLGLWGSVTHGRGLSPLHPPEEEAQDRLVQNSPGPSTVVPFEGGTRTGMALATLEQQDRRLLTMIVLEGLSHARSANSWAAPPTWWSFVIAGPENASRRHSAHWRQMRLDLHAVCGSPTSPRRALKGGLARHAHSSPGLRVKTVGTSQSC